MTMKGVLTLFIFATSLLFHPQVEGSEDLPTSLCLTKQATESLLDCKTNFVQVAGENFTNDCDGGVVQDFMRCITAIEGCKNLSEFVEKAFYDYYGCIDTSIDVYKRALDRERRLVCSYACGYSCGIRCYYSYFYGYRCYYSCRRICRFRCYGKRDVPSSNDQSPHETPNLCSDCVCSVDVENPPRYLQNNGERPRQLEANNSAMKFQGHLSGLFLLLCLVTITLL